MEGEPRAARRMLWGLCVFASLTLASCVLFLWQSQALTPRAASIFSIVGIGAFLVARWGIGKARQPVVVGALIGAFAFVLLELALEGLAWISVLPGLSFYHHVPFGRAYWTREGFSNGVMNRFGWHYPEFRLESDAEKIAVVGDSFVEALQVPPEASLGRRLQAELSDISAFKAASTRSSPEVLGLGISSIGPAQYLEIERYALSHFQPRQIVVVFALRNDIRNSSAALQPELSPKDYIYYAGGVEGLNMLPESEEAARRFRAKLEANHLPLLPIFGRSVVSHLVSLNACLDIREWIAARAREDIRKSHLVAGASDFDIDKEQFRKNQMPEVQEAFRMASALLLKGAQEASAAGASYRVLSIPYFPREFYEQKLAGPGAKWGPQVGEYDFLAPEEALAEFAVAHGFEFVRGGALLREAGLSLAEIKPFYFAEGTGHLTEAGHAFFARGLAAAIRAKAAAPGDK